MGDPPCWMHLFGDGEHSSTALPSEVAARLLHDLADAVVVTDTNETIVYWNPAAERLFGWTASEACGQSLELIVPERHLARHSAGYRKVMQTGVTQYAERLLRVPCRHRDGGTRSIAFTVSLVRSASGTVEGVVAVVRDETERWAEEKALRSRLAELEESP